MTFQNVFRANWRYRDLRALVEKKKEKKHFSGFEYFFRADWSYRVSWVLVESKKKENFTEPKGIFLTVWATGVLGLLMKKISIELGKLKTRPTTIAIRHAAISSKHEIYVS